MYTIVKSLLGFALVVLALILWKPVLLRPLTSPLRRLRGPPAESRFLGNLRALYNSSDSLKEEQYLNEYGHVIKIPAILQLPYLLTTDTRAINHVLTHSMDYQKSKQSREQLSFFVGDGVLAAEEDQHRRQRRVLNPAFGPAQIRDLTEVFFEKALQLRNAWSGEIEKGGHAMRIEVLAWLSRVTLDIIGLAGFNYEFNSLSGSTDELERAFSTMFDIQKPSIFSVLQAIFKPLQKIRTERLQRSEESRAVMQRIGTKLIADKKTAILAEKSFEKGQPLASKDDLPGRDLLTLLIKANLAVDIPENQRLSDAEVLGQVPTFIVAGHETTSGATMWCLFALSKAQDVQRNLREELLTIGTDTPTMDELNALPYLDMVVRETLRIHSPVPMSHRVAQKDDLLPLEKPFTDRYGEVHDNIRVAKGDAILIPIAIMNRSKAFWGEDAAEFKPERWEDPPETIHGIPGVWSDMMTFLGGPRSCIGYRFALTEMKALIFTLVRAFEFSLAIPAEEISKRTFVTQRPIVLSEKEKGSQMPLMVKMHQRL